MEQEMENGKTADKDSVTKSTTKKNRKFRIK